MQYNHDRFEERKTSWRLEDTDEDVGVHNEAAISSPAPAPAPHLLTLMRWRAVP